MEDRDCLSINLIAIRRAHALDEQHFGNGYGIQEAGD